MSDCPHMKFSANVAVNRLEDTGRFSADVTIKCSDCGMPFQFLGLEPGMDTHGARLSIDGLEARLAIAPKDAKPSPLQRMVFNIKRFDS
ncbi:MAG TPA: hypothetical protein VH020_09395 [Stellaceae bacterium]|nr:hypothetical protein [Stellaceae bacterium]